MSKVRIARAKRSLAWTRIGEQNVAKMIRLADRGNIDAGRRLLDLSARCLRDSLPLPVTLANWLAARLDAVVSAPKRAGQELRVCNERGRPPYASNDMHEALAYESLQQMAAWAVFHEIYPDSMLTSNFEAQPEKMAAACKSVSDWLTEKGRSPVSAKTIEAWYYARREGMIKETRRVQEIMCSLNAPI